MKHPSLAASIILSLCLCSWSQTTATRPADAPPKDIAALFAGSPAEVDEALALVPTLVANEPGKVSSQAKAWLKALADAKRHAAVESLGLALILSMPSETATVEYCQTARVRALLAAGKAEAALSQAKALFNVSSMAGTSASILLVAECLNANKPGDIMVVRDFRLEQMAGAKPPSTAPATGERDAKSSALCPTLRAIRIDPEPYEKTYRQIYGEDYASLVAKGNLLLLSDRVAEAREAFERAYGVGPDASIAAATENLARVIKAEDGTIGRANAWIASLKTGTPPVKPVRVKP